MLLQHYLNHPFWYHIINVYNSIHILKILNVLRQTLQFVKKCISRFISQPSFFSSQNVRSVSFSLYSCLINKNLEWLINYRSSKRFQPCFLSARLKTIDCYNSVIAQGDLLLNRKWIVYTWNWEWSIPGRGCHGLSWLLLYSPCLFLLVLHCAKCKWA